MDSIGLLAFPPTHIHYTQNTHTHTHIKPRVENSWNVFLWLLPPPEAALQAERSTDLCLSNSFTRTDG